MPSIKLKVQISGTRNGEEWPAPGTVVDLPEDEAATLIAAGLAVEPDDAEEAAVVQPAEETATAPGDEATAQAPAGDEAATAPAAGVETATKKSGAKASSS